jgi:hypothetical protein
MFIPAMLMMMMMITIMMMMMIMIMRILSFAASIFHSAGGLCV